MVLLQGCAGRALPVLHALVGYVNANGAKAFQKNYPLQASAWLAKLQQRRLSLRGRRNDFKAPCGERLQFELATRRSYELSLTTTSIRASGCGPAADGARGEACRPSRAA